jgi:hypothetical protein
VTSPKPTLPLCCCLHPEGAHKDSRGPCAFCHGARRKNPCLKLTPISHHGTHAAQRGDKPRKINASRTGEGDMILVTFEDLHLMPMDTKTDALVATVRHRDVMTSPFGRVHVIDTDLGSFSVPGEYKITLITRKKP